MVTQLTKNADILMTAFFNAVISLKLCKHWLFAKMNGDMLTYADTESYSLLKINFIYIILYNK